MAFFVDETFLFISILFKSEEFIKQKQLSKWPLQPLLLYTHHPEVFTATLYICKIN